MKTEVIHSLKELQLKMPAIIKQYGNDNNLTHIALANPIIALERTGLKFTDEAKEEIEKHVRFGKEGAKRYNDLREKINTSAGSKIDLKNHEQIANIIFGVDKQTKASTSPRETKKTLSQEDDIDRGALLIALSTHPKKINNQIHDTLTEFALLHPIIPLLIEYRQIEFERPEFTPPKDISKIEERLRQSPLKNVVFKLKRNNRNND